MCLLKLQLHFFTPDMSLLHCRVPVCYSMAGFGYSALPLRIISATQDCFSYCLAKVPAAKRALVRHKQIQQFKIPATHQFGPLRMTTASGSNHKDWKRSEQMDAVYGQQPAATGGRAATTRTWICWRRWWMMVVVLWLNGAFLSHSSHIISPEATFNITCPLG